MRRFWGKHTLRRCGRFRPCCHCSNNCWRFVCLTLLVILFFGLVQLYHLWSNAVRADVTPQLVYDTDKDIYTQLNPRYRVGHNTTHINGYPKVLHHVYYKIPGEVQPKWMKARQTCINQSPDFVHMYWNESAVEDFFSQHYPWFLATYHSYVYTIQRIDSIRYFLLYHYGGVYIDMDIYCRISITTILRSFPIKSAVVLQETQPDSYLTNSLLFAHARHPFFDFVIHHLENSNRQYFFPYMTIMFSTSPVYLSNCYYNYMNASHKPASSVTARIPPYTAKSRSEVYIIQNEFNQKLFYEMGSSSWHQWDARIILYLFSHLPNFVVTLFV